MKEYILRREAFLRLFSLVLVVVSVFLTNQLYKMVLLVLGVIGLILVSYAKGQKALLFIFSFLLILAFVGYFLISRGIVRI